MSYLFFFMLSLLYFFFFFFFNDTATTEIYTLSLHDALPIFGLTLVEAAEGVVERVGLLETARGQRHHAEPDARPLAPGHRQPHAIDVGLAEQAGGLEAHLVLIDQRQPRRVPQAAERVVGGGDVGPAEPLGARAAVLHQPLARDAGVTVLGAGRRGAEDEDDEGRRCAAEPLEMMAVHGGLPTGPRRACAG